MGLFLLRHDRSTSLLGIWSVALLCMALCTETRTMQDACPLSSRRHALKAASSAPPASFCAVSVTPSEGRLSIQGVA